MREGETEREIERGAHAERTREEVRQSGAECGAVVRADGGEEGKREAREGGEVCCAAVGTDCRASEQLALLSFSFYRSGRRACRLSLYRSGRAAPVASPSVVCRPLALSPAPERTSPILLLPSLSHSSSSLASARKRTGLGRVSFPPSLPPSRAYPRPIVFIVLWISPPPSATALCAGRQQSPLPVHTHTYIHTPYPPRRIVPAENRAFFRTPGRDSSPISFRSPVIN